jgi:signal transduction histidine kinase
MPVDTMEATVTQRLTFSHSMRNAFDAVVRFISRYPAILAAYFIYGYYFISTMNFYIRFKQKHFGASEVLSHFDTILWMWLLAWMLVRIIELRENLHAKEKENLQHQSLIQIKETQLKTLHEVVLTLKHQINNPLAIILGYVRLAQKKNTDQDITKKLDEIEIAAQRINGIVRDFTVTREYEVMESPVGNLVVPPSETKKS